MYSSSRSSVGVDGVLGRRRCAIVDAEPVRPDPRDRDLVCRAAQLEVDGPADRVLHLRPAAARGLEQAGALDRLLVLVGLDAGRDQGDAGVPVRDQPALAADPVDPAGVGAAVDDLGLVEQVEDEALVRRAALDDDGGLAHGAAQPGQRLVAVAAEAMILAIIESKSAGIESPSPTPVSTRTPGPAGRSSRAIRPGDGREVAVGVLGVEPGLDGVARPRPGARPRAGRPRRRGSAA